MRRARDCDPERKAKKRRLWAADSTNNHVRAARRRRQLMGATSAARAGTSSAKSARAHRPEVTSRAGTWAQAAQNIAGACAREGPAHLPPSYAALNIQSCLAITGQMYECMEECEWVTCVVCWRAWYDLPPHYHFDDLSSAPALRPRHGSHWQTAPSWGRAGGAQQTSGDWEAPAPWRRHANFCQRTIRRQRVQLSSTA